VDITRVLSEILKIGPQDNQTFLPSAPVRGTSNLCQARQAFDGVSTVYVVHVKEKVER